jgi:hypothetical protein
LSSASERTESIYQEALSLSDERQVNTCMVGDILDRLVDPERSDLLRAFADNSLRGTIIAEVLTNRGHKISSHTVQRHRRGACSCPEENYRG